MRTTVDLDPLVLAELKKRQLAEGKTLGQVVSELLGPALRATGAVQRDFVWPSRSMAARFDINDKDSLWATLDRD